MLDILKRLDEEHTSSSSLGIGEEGDGGCELPLEERLAGLDLGELIVHYNYTCVLPCFVDLLPSLPLSVLSRWW